jgi:arylformamidase
MRHARKAHIVDLSHPIAPGMPVYPGDPAPTLAPVTDYADAGYVTRLLTVGSHTGTHMDAPAHMLPGGRTLDAFPVTHFTGPALVLHLPSASGAVISPAALRAHAGALAVVDFLLLDTGWAHRWGGADYFTGYPVLSPDAARWLAAQGLKGLGVDTPSVDADDAELFSVHHALLGADMVLVENLTALSALPARVTFAAFPLRLVDADGSPVRAVAYLPD